VGGKATSLRYLNQDFWMGFSNYLFFKRVE